MKTELRITTEDKEPPTMTQLLNLPTSGPIYNAILAADTVVFNGVVVKDRGVANGST